MAKYRCDICGYVFDEEKEGRLFSSLKACPACFQDVNFLLKLDNGPAAPVNSSTMQRATLPW